MSKHRALLAVVLSFAAAPATAQEAMTAQNTSLESTSLLAAEPAPSAAVAIRTMRTSRTWSDRRA